MKIFKHAEITPTHPGEGVTHRVLAHDASIMGAEVSFEKGSVGALHSHPHEQFAYIVSGKFEYEEDGVKTILVAGDSYYSKPNVRHGAVCLEAGIILDVFTPRRDDFLK